MKGRPDCSVGTRALLVACGAAVVLAVLITCSSPPKVPVVDGAVMSISRSQNSIPQHSPRYESHLQLSWFGTACHLIQLGDLSVLTDPFVSKGPFLLTRPESDPEQVRNTLGRIAPPDAVFVSHSHHDHIQDAFAAMSLPVWRSQGVPLYGGLTCRHILAGWRDPEVLARVHALDGEGEATTGIWHTVPIDPAKQRCGYALRFVPFRSEHTPHLRCGKTFFDGFVKEPRKTPPSRLRDFQAGEVYNYLIELKSPRTTFRVLCLGAPYDLKERPESMPQAGRHSIDVAIMLAPSWKNAPGYPVEHMLRARPRHVVLSHFDSFAKKNSEEVTSLFGIDLVRMNELLREMQSSFSRRAVEYPEFRQILVPAVTRLDGNGGPARNVIHIPPSRR